MRAVLAAATLLVGCAEPADTGDTGTSTDTGETTTHGACSLAGVDGLSLAASDPLSATPYTLGYPPYAAGACELAYVAAPAAGEATGALLLRDLESGDEVVIAPASERPRRPAMKGDVLAWEADEGGIAVVRVRTKGTTVTLQGAFHHAGEPRVTDDGVVFTAFLEEDASGDTDIHVAVPGEAATEALFTGPGQQRFADISASHVAFADFSEDPDGAFDDDEDLADVVVIHRATREKKVRPRPGKQAFPLLGATGDVAYLEWPPGHPEPKLSAYYLMKGDVEGTGEGDALVVEVQTAMPYVRPAAAADRLSWVDWPQAGAPSLWTRPADLSAPASRVTGIEGPTLLGPAVTSDVTLAIVVTGGAATLRAAAH